MINENRLVKTFIEMVEINSESFEEKEMMEYVEKKLKKLGMRVDFDNAGEIVGSNATNIYGYYEGNNELSPIVLSAHMDTVKPGNNVKVVIDGDVIKTDGTTVLGGDDKSGIAIALECLETIVENNLDSRPVEVVFTICEEVGLLGGKHVDYSKISAKNAIVFDSGGEIGLITVQAPGQYKITGSFKGVPAHAGIEPEKGINAIQVAAHAIENMPLLRIDSETTANVGFFNAGVATNIVTPEAVVICEARSTNASKLDAQVKAMVKSMEDAASKYNTTVDVETVKAYDPYVISSDEKIVADFSKAFELCGVDAKLVPSGGGSDSNSFNKNGITSIVTSTGMSKVHTTDEFIKKSDMILCAKALLAYLHEVK